MIFKSVFSSLLLLTIILVNDIHCSDYAQRKAEKKLIEDLISPSKYDKDIRPGVEGPTVVTINMFVRDIYNFHPGTQTMNVQVTFREQWKDDRLTFDDKNGTIKSLNVPGNGQLIWTPDVFFSNEREGRTHDLMRPNVQVRVLSSGMVLYSRRITLKVTCQMCLKHYPFDNQNCSMKIASYGMTTDDVIFKWKDVSAVNVNKNLVLRNFKYVNVTQEECVGEFTCLRAIFRFDRILWPHITQLYAPSAFIHIISYIPFYFKSRNDCSRIIRVFISFFSFLFLTWFCVTSETTRSPDSYEFNSKDIWVAGISLITFTSFIHVCITEILSSSVYAKYGTSPKIIDIDVLDKDNENGYSGYGSVGQGYKRRLSMMPHVKISYISCVLYPLFFAVFNIAYWGYFVGFKDD